jgi:hypothetical protein
MKDFIAHEIKDERRNAEHETLSAERCNAATISAE